MDTRITPFGDHPDGGKIKELDPNEEIPNYMMPLNDEARKILEGVPVRSRVDFILGSTNPELAEQRAFLEDRLKKESPATYAQLEYNRCKKDFEYWYKNYFSVRNK